MSSTEITFGLTGGIACGKSTVTKTFRKYNIPIVDADVVARQVVEVGTWGWRLIRAQFGDEYLNEDNTINRTKLGALVFNDKEAMKNLNYHMGNLIGEESTKQIAALHDAGSPIVGYDAALIVEMGNAKKYKPLIVVHCKPEQQLERLMRRNDLTKEEAIRRIEAQLPVAEKLKVADFAIDTSGTIEESIKQTETLIAAFRFAL